jgi:asparagine synthase (glutamine-hydrolysing)
MCGITGFFTFQNTPYEPNELLTRMSNQLERRGPDSSGTWADPTAGIGFGHRRLAIVDLTSEGHQPMHSASQRFAMTFNGEIYNFHELRAALEVLGHSFRGHSDTEVMLAAFEQWGVEASLKRMVGMFAFALWDKQDRVLYLSRDRMGEKPLYYGWMGKTLVFGSTLNALRAHPAWQGEINRDALALFMRHNYIPAPYSIFKGIYKLPAANYLKLTFAEAERQHLPKPIPYWSHKLVAEQGSANPFQGDGEDVVNELERLLKQAIAGQMIADVPLGAFLSGGVDSSTIVALMQAQSTQPVKTFTIGFDEPGFNEAEFAKAVAKHLGTDHTELYVKPEEALAVIPQMSAYYDEPFADSSQLPTFLVSQLARKHVTVSLSGDAGDELFGGYRRYFGAQKAWDRIANWPSALKKTAAAGFNGIAAVSGLATQAGHANLPAKVNFQAQQWAQNLSVERPELMYHRLASHWDQPTKLVLQSQEPPTPLTDTARMAKVPSFIESMMYLDSVTYLPDDILVKVDRASMAVSLESRVPLLDHRIVEFAWRVPLAHKVRDGVTKWPLRQLLYRHVPASLIERPKKGFSIPLAKWLSGPLRAWAEDLLSEKQLREGGFLNPAIVRAKWQEQLSGQSVGWRVPAEQLWNVLMFQSWLADSSRPLT